MPATPPIDLASKVIHDIFAVFAVLATIILLSISMGATSEQNSLFLTNTFLSAYYSDVPAVTYSPAGDPYTPALVADTYYSCLYEAQVGVDQFGTCVGDNLKDYTACLIMTTTSLESRRKRAVAVVQEILGAYKGDTWNVSSLPSILTTSNLTTLGIDLTDPGEPSKLATLLNTLSNIDSILSRDLIAGIKRTVYSMGIPGCLLQVDQNPGVLHDIAPVYDQLWQCTASVVHTEISNSKAFGMCIPQSSWPALDVMQTPYSSTFLGSYNKHFVLVIGMWLMCSFAVYSAWVGADGSASVNGKPRNFFARSGMFLTIFSFVWNFAAVIIVIVRGFTTSDNANNFPMSIQTVMVTLFFTIVATMYFGRELWEIIRYSGGDPSSSRGGNAGQPARRKKIRAGFPASFNGARGQYSHLSTFMSPTATGDEAYIPLLSPAWSDCLLLCDGLILLGIVGTSPDVVTADIVACFVYVTAANAVHTAFVRLLENAYTEDDKERTSLRVMAMASNIAILMFSIMYWYLAFSRYGANALIISYVILSSMIPCLVWLVINMLLDFEVILVDLLYPSQFVFIYQMTVRSIFAFVVVSTLRTDVDATFHNSDSLLAMVKYISQ